MSENADPALKSGATESGIAGPAEVRYITGSPVIEDRPQDARGAMPSIGCARREEATLDSAVAPFPAQGYKLLGRAPGRVA